MATTTSDNDDEQHIVVEPGKRNVLDIRVGAVERRFGQVDRGQMMGSRQCRDNRQEQVDTGRWLAGMACLQLVESIAGCRGVRRADQGLPGTVQRRVGGTVLGRLAFQRDRQVGTGARLMGMVAHHSGACFPWEAPRPRRTANPPPPRC